PDAHGYATLAQLRDRIDDPVSRDRALAKCRKMTRHKKTVCTLSRIAEPAKPSPQPRGKRAKARTRS
ncbi:MAG: hypothetical protein AAGC55_13160, partial [Myxococcota bacterium]